MTSFCFRRQQNGAKLFCQIEELFSLTETLVAKSSETRKCEVCSAAKDHSIFGTPSTVGGAGVSSAGHRRLWGGAGRHR